LTALLLLGFVVDEELVESSTTRDHGQDGNLLVSDNL